MQTIVEKEIIKDEKVLNKKERDEGIELLRMLSMFFVLVLHYCDKGGFLSNKLFDNINFEIAWLIEAFSIVAVNCYVLISGYFLINSNYKRKKIIKLIGEVWFYSVAIWGISVIFFNIKLTIKETIMFLLPTTLKIYWFITCYVILYLLVPYINSMIKNISKKELLVFIGILFTISFGSLILSYLGFNSIDMTRGYGILWFIVLYCIGAYIKLYYNENNYNKYKYLILYVMLSVFVYFTRCILLLVSNNRPNLSNLFYNYNSITILLSSICLFLFFKNLKVKNKYMKAIILRMAPLTLAIYIIHEHPIIRGILYKDILHTDFYLYSKKFVIVLLISCISIYIIGCLIEYLRRKILNILTKIFKRYYKKILKNDAQLDKM